MAKRKSISASVETDVLTRSKRKCCLCFFLEGDNGTKKGQIAHLDRNPGNGNERNLAFLCQQHHDEYDSRPSQTKGMTINEVKHARDELYKSLCQTPEETNEVGPLPSNRVGEHGGVAVAAETQAIQLILPRDFDSFTDAEQAKVLRGIGEFLGVSDIKVICMERGTVRLTLELKSEDAGRLLRAAKAGDLADLGVADARLVQKRQQPPARSRRFGRKQDFASDGNQYLGSISYHPDSQKRPRGKKLYVGNLSYSTSSSDLEALLAAHGTVLSAEVISDRTTGQSKGFGFVEMNSEEEAQAAIAALDGQDSDGRTLKVNEAIPRERSGGGGGGFRGGGGRRDRY